MSDAIEFQARQTRWLKIIETEPKGRSFRAMAEEMIKEQPNLPLVAWLHFIQKLQPELSTKSDQYKEMRPCYMAGMTEMWSFVNGVTEVFSDDRALELVSNMEDQLLAFHQQQIQRGAAVSVKDLKYP